MIWVDSGAYSAHTTGKVITLEEYARYLQSNRGGWDYAFTLDSIGDPKGSRRNTEWLTQRQLPVVPVFHFGTPISEFESLAREYGYVAVGGMVPLTKGGKRALVGRYLRTLTLIAEKYGAGVHALGVGGLPTVRQSRVWSSDASTISSSPVSGRVIFWDGNRTQALVVADAAKMWKMAPKLRSMGFPIEQMVSAGGWPKDSACRIRMFQASLRSFAQMWAQERVRNPLHAPQRLPASDIVVSSARTGMTLTKIAVPVGPRSASSLANSEVLKGAML